MGPIVDALHPTQIAMTLPTPAEADAATARVRVVADMLRQKALDMQSKGNAGAAQSLGESAADLQRAVALLQELTRHAHANGSAAAPGGLPRRDSEASLVSSGPPSQDGSRAPPVSASVKDLVGKLGRVDVLLGKKSDEMKAKGNENAAHALQQSALVVRLGVQHITEQQQMTRTLVATARALREQLREQIRLLLADEEVDDETPLDEELRQRAVGRAKEFIALKDALGTQTGNADPEEVDRLNAEVSRLQTQLHEDQAQHERELLAAREEITSIKKQCAALEKALHELEAEYHERREKELDHLNVLHERQKETHEELKLVLLAKEEEVSSLKLQAESWMSQLSKQQDTVAELQAQREHDRQYHEQVVCDLREQLSVRDNDIRELQRLLDQLSSKEDGARDLDEADSPIEELRQMLDEERHRCDAIAAERGELLAALEDARSQILSSREEFRTRLEEEQQRLVAAQNHADACTARLADLEAALEEKKLEIEAFAARTDTTELQHSVEALRSELHTEQQNSEQLRLRLETEKKAREELQVKLNEARNDLNEARALVADEMQRAQQASATSVKELQNEVTRLDEALRHATVHQQDIETELNSKDQALDKLRTQLQESTELEQTRESKALAMKSELEASISSVCGLVENLETLEDFDALLVKYEEQDGILTDSGNEIVNRVWTALKNLATISRELATKRIAELEGRALSLNSAIVGVLGLSGAQDGEETVTILRQRMVSHTAQVAKMEEKLAAATRDLETARQLKEEETTKLKTEVTRLQDSIAQLEQEKTLAHEYLHNLEARHAEVATSEASNETKCARLRQKLATVEADFEKYRTRSHAALKKVEKRAELLNSMRKENEELVNEITGLKEQCEKALGNEARAVAQLEEAMQNLLMREEDVTQQIHNSSIAFTEMEDKCVRLENAKSTLEERLIDADKRITELQREKEDLAAAKHTLHEQAIAAKCVELEECRKLLLAKQSELNASVERVSELEGLLVTQQNQMITLQANLEKLQSETDEFNHEGATNDIEMKELRVKVSELEALVEGKESELERLRESLVAAEAAVNEDTDKLKAQHVMALESAQQDINAKDKAIQDLCAEKDTLRYQVSQLEDELRATIVGLEELQLRWMTLQAEQATAQTPIQTAGSKEETTRDAETRDEQVVKLVETLGAKEAQIHQLLSELGTLKAETAGNQNTIDALKERLQETEERLEAVTQRSASDADVEALQATILSQRKHIVALESSLETLQTDMVEEDAEEGELDTGKQSEDEITKAQAARELKRAQYEHAQETAKRKKHLMEFKDKTDRVVVELQQRLDEYSSVFRDACELRDILKADATSTTVEANGSSSVPSSKADDVEYEEYLTFKSGVVVKAGATFSLPVFCDKPGGRVEWKFSVKEDGADVGFALFVAGMGGARETNVAPERVNELSGAYEVPLSNTTMTLFFEWDNTFSWLNEKTLDYHVSVLEPLSEEKKALRAEERSLRRKISELDEKLELLATERQRRAQLENAVRDFEECEKEKIDQLSLIERRKRAIGEAKAQLQVHMEDLKAQLGAFVKELDELDNDEQSVTRAWETLRNEEEDVEMTMRLSANSRLDQLASALQEKHQSMNAELAEVQRKLQAA